MALSSRRELKRRPPVTLMPMEARAATALPKLDRRTASGAVGRHSFWPFVLTDRPFLAISRWRRFARIMNSPSDQTNSEWIEQ